MEAAKRAERLLRIRDMLRGSARGFTPRELASTTGVDVRTIQRDLNTLQWKMGEPLRKADGRYAFERAPQLSPLTLSVHEARALLIATRLFLRHTDESDPAAATALERLAAIMPEPVRAQVKAAIASLQARPFDADFARNLATVTDAWSRRRVLRLSYRSAGKQRPKEVVLEPYFLEPSAAGFATYVIGYSRTHAAMRTFKVERIVSAEMLPEAFTLPADASIDGLLKSAWGIIWGEGVHVRLRFRSDVAWRVRESTWHPSQQIEEQDDGSVVLTMSVASMMELGRWVRSWGDAVEVLAPASLRQELREEAVRLARTYAAPAKRTRRARIA